MKLIVNADDLGMSEAITHRILEAHRRGIVRSASAFPHGPALRLARKAGLALGLHVNLSFGSPLAPDVPSLVDAGGAFVAPMELLSRRGLADEIAREIDAQIRCFADESGALPDHLDAHQHLAYLHPEAFAPFADAARSWQIPIRCPLEFAIPERFDRFVARLVRDHPTLNRDLFRETAAAVRRHLHSELRYPDVLHHDFGTFDLETMAAGITELMSHPGDRDDELAFLTAPETHDAIRRQRIELTTFQYVAEAA